MSLDDSFSSFGRWAVDALDRLLVWLERDRLPLFLMFLYVMAVATVRDLVEYFLLDPEFVSTPHPWIYSIAHHVSFYLVVFMGLVFLITAFSGRGVRRCLNYVSMFWWIIVLPPVIDHYLFGLDQNYAYFSITDFINALFRFSGEKFNPGQALEVGIVIFALIAYVVWTSRHMLFSVKDRAITFTRIGLMVVFTFVSLFIAATPASFLPVAPEEFPYFDLTRYYQYHLFFFLYYLLAAVVLALALTYLATKPNFGRVLRSMRPAQTVFFAGIVAAGVVAGWRASSTVDLVANILQEPFWVNLAFFGVAAIAAILAWQVSTIWNDISDRASDSATRKYRALASGLLPPGALLQVSLVLAFAALACSLLLSLQQALVVAVILALSFVYSFKPVRFKDHILSPLLIGLGTFLAFVYGCLTPYSVVGVVPSSTGDIFYLTGEVAFPRMGMEELLLGLFMFLGLVVGSMVTDLDGYAEDARAGVRTVYTRLGVERGVRLVAALIMAVALTPLALFQAPFDVVVFAALGACAALLFLRLRRSRPVMLVAMAGLLYAALRFLDVVQF